MNITFLIGNGFDRNLGLDTTYSDFIKVYKKSQAKSQTIKTFHSYIDENEELWSSAEEAFGQYTSEFGVGEGDQFSECQADFCENLAQYLKEQELRIDYSSAGEKIIKAFSRLNSITSPFPAQERAILEKVFESYASEGISFNFICYNYTRTLDKCLSLLKRKSAIIGSHKYGSQVRDHAIGQLCHVHGTVEKEMVFGVNDETQILNTKLFECDDGDLYKNLLIKKQANAAYMENTDGKANQILTSSKIIYVYGMSCGYTDNLWWDRICKWLTANNTNHLILQKYETPPKRVIPVLYQRFEREQRRQFMEHSQLDEEKKRSIKSQIHITGDNIFECIHNIANPASENVAEEIDRIAVEV